ncbi:MAG: Zn-ribbon domain-containing OB-fold protein [Candidatus Methanofastidiosia archaeon]
MIERITRVLDMVHVMGEIPVEYFYTAGIAGERFFEEMRENARILGRKCKKCDIIYVPPRIFCERCFERLEEWVSLENRGKILTYTISYIDMNDEKLEEPIIIAFVKFDYVHGGLVHRVSEVDLDDVEIGMEVEALFKGKKEREGSIMDIKYFRPLKGKVHET